MSRSDVFDNYARIALEKGLIRNTEETMKKGAAQNPRHDAATTKEIAKLYNVKNEKPADMEYKKNIVEDAHPDPVVLFRSHDKINSLIENINERQNIIINILQKPVNGLLVQKKYAEELTLSLIRIATDMDNQDHEELRVLADTCAVQLQKQGFDFKDFLSERGGDAIDVGTGALSGAAIGGIAGGLIGVFGGPVGVAAGAAGGAALGGILSSIFKTSPQAKNVVINSEIARNQLTDIIKDHPADPFLQQLDGALLHITNTAATYARTVDAMHMPESGPADKVTAEKTANLYLTEIARMNVMIGTFLQNAKAGKYVADDSDVWSKIKTPFSAILGDDVSDEVKALQTLQRVIKEAQLGINETVREAQGLKAQIAATPTPAPVAPKEDPESGFMSQFKGLMPDMEELEKDFK